MIKISIDNIINLISEGGIICFLGGDSNLTKNLTTYLLNECKKSPCLYSTTICESVVQSEILNDVKSFVINSHQKGPRKDSKGMITFKPKNPSLFFVKNINKSIFTHPVMEILTYQSDITKYIKIFSTNDINNISPFVMNKTDIWIVTDDSSRENIQSLISYILDEYEFDVNYEIENVDDFMELLEEHRVIIIYKKKRDKKGKKCRDIKYELYSFSDVCCKSSMDISSLVRKVFYEDICNIVLGYSYPVI